MTPFFFELCSSGHEARSWREAAGFGRRRRRAFRLPVIPGKRKGRRLAAAALVMDGNERLERDGVVYRIAVRVRRNGRGGGRQLGAVRLRRWVLFGLVEELLSIATENFPLLSIENFSL